MKTVKVELTKRELTHIRVGLLQRMDRLKNAIEKTAGDDSVAEVRTETQTSYDEIKALMDAKLWVAVQNLKGES